MKQNNNIEKAIRIISFLQDRNSTQEIDGNWLVENDKLFEITLSYDIDDGEYFSKKRVMFVSDEDLCLIEKALGNYLYGQKVDKDKEFLVENFYKLLLK